MRREDLRELEPERYELGEEPWYRLPWQRREFLKSAGGGLAVFLVWPELRESQESGRAGRSSQDLPEELGAWLQVDPQGRITVYTGKVEVGQNARTSLSQIVAEELHVPISSLRLVMGDTRLTPYDRGTFGSRTTPMMGTYLQKVAATAREVLLEEAARAWGVEKEMLRAVDGKVVDARSGRSVTYGDLTQGRELLRKVEARPPLTPPEKWQKAGRAVQKVNGVDFVTGRHRFTSDLQLPGMWYGKILRPPSAGAALEWVDVSGAEALPGVQIIREGAFVGVVAPHERLAEKALGLIRAGWKEKPQPSRAELFRYLKSNPVERQGWGGRSHFETGSFSEAWEKAGEKVEATYLVDYIAHAPLEPRAAVADWEGDQLTVWTGTQRPFGVRSELAETFHLSEDRIRVIVPDTGSGYGGKHTGEAAVEAARLARACGKPVKLVWTREEEFQWAYFRPAGVIEVRSALDAEGRLLAWEFHNYNSGAAGIRTPYRVPHQRVVFHPTRYPLRQGSYRALAATANHFARECQMNEMAARRGLDPLEFRLQNLEDDRLKAVLQAAAARFGWEGRGREPGRGYGLAAGTEKGSYVATCVEVQGKPDLSEVRVTRIGTAFECGVIVNPGHLRSQVEGCLVQGLGGALFERIDFENGKVLNGRFSRYRVPRFSDLPALEVVLLNRPDLPPAGAGETPIVALAPAIAQALFELSGRRLRTLPLLPEGTVQEEISGAGGWSR